jgi:hypothetical protein
MEESLLKELEQVATAVSIRVALLEAYHAGRAEGLGVVAGISRGPMADTVERVLRSFYD